MHWFRAAGSFTVFASRPLLASGLSLTVLLALAAVFSRLPIATHYAAREVYCWIIASGLLAVYVWGYWRLRTSPATGQTVVVALFAVCFCLLALAIKPFLDIDLDCYINIGWQQAGHRCNPYVFTLEQTPGYLTDPMFHTSMWNNVPCAYGFLFCRAARALCQLGGGRWQLTMQLFRVVGIGVFLLAGVVLWLGCRFLRVAAPERALYLFWWNPLMLTQCVVQGHNDLWMALFTLSALCGAVAGGWLVVMPLLALAILVKYFAAVAVPFALVYLVREHGLRKALTGSALGIVVGLAVAWPYLHDLPHFAVGKQLNNAGEIHGSCISVVDYAFEDVERAFPRAKALHARCLKVLRLAIWGAFFGLWLFLVCRACRARHYDGRDLIRDAVLMHFALICFVSTKFYPWYLGMYFPLALWLAPEDWLRRATLAISCSLIFVLTFIGRAHYVNIALIIVLPLTWALWSRPRCRLVLLAGDARRARLDRKGSRTAQAA